MLLLDTISCKDYLYHEWLILSVIPLTNCKLNLFLTLFQYKTTDLI